MQNPLGDDGALSRTQLHRAAFEINQQLPFNHVEEFVIIVMLVPMVFTLHNTETNHRPVHPAEGLVVPLVGAGVGEGSFIHDFQRLAKNVESGLVGEPFHTGHRMLPSRRLSVIISTPYAARPRANLSYHALRRSKKGGSVPWGASLHHKWDAKRRSPRQGLSQAPPLAGYFPAL